jgi:hypothetical protein
MTGAWLNPRMAVGSSLLGIATNLLAVAVAVAEPIEPKAIDPTVTERGGAIEQPVSPGPASRIPQELANRGNPLWAIPLTDLSATRARPVFSPSRRPPPPPVVVAPYVPPPPPSQPVEPDRPQLALVGTIAGEDGAFGIFLDQATNTVVRLKLNDRHRGWTLRQVFGREAVFQKDALTAVLVLPSPGTKPEAAGTQVADDPPGRRARR